MKLVTASQMTELEQIAIEEYGIDGLLLMENAARSFCDILEAETGFTAGKTIVIFCGKGNNGGDGFAIGRHLSNRGANVTVVTDCPPDSLKPDAKKNYDILCRMGLPIVPFSELSCQKADIIVDALFGTGFHGAVRGTAKDMIAAINQGNMVISVDIPSGACASDGSVGGDCVRADFTVTFALAKPGHILYPAKEFCGKVLITDISIPRHVSDNFPATYYTLDEELRKVLPTRSENSHKGSFGKVLLFAGSPGMSGACIMAATAVLKSGAGMATAAIPDTMVSLFAEHFKEVMTLPLPTASSGLSESAVTLLTKRLAGQDVLLAGCGLGTSEETRKVLLPLLSTCEKPMVIDADGINLLKEHIHIIKNKAVPAIITPHPLEFSRLTGYSVEDIQNNRLAYAQKFAAETGIILVLKGADTLVAHPDGQIYICTQSNSGLAKAGSGDVLAGVIASLLAQGARPEDAANLGVYIHSRAGMIARKEKGAYGMLAGDVLQALPLALEELSGTKQE